MSKQETFELKDFISKSLLDICEAVEEVRKKHSYVATDYAHYPTNDKNSPHSSHVEGYSV